MLYLLFAHIICFPGNFRPILFFFRANTQQTHALHIYALSEGLNAHLLLLFIISVSLVLFLKNIHMWSHWCKFCIIKWKIGLLQHFYVEFNACSRLLKDEVIYKSFENEEFCTHECLLSSVLCISLPLYCCNFTRKVSFNWLICLSFWIWGEAWWRQISALKVNKYPM